MQGVEVSNQSLQSAVARAEEAAALLLSAKMAFLPTLDASASGTRSKSGSQGGSTNPNSLTNRGSGLQRSRSVAFATVWEADLWGRLRHNAGAATADAQAAQADVESARLSLQAQAAQTYFSLRATDAQKRLWRARWRATRSLSNSQGTAKLRESPPAPTSLWPGRSSANFARRVDRSRRATRDARTCPGRTHRPGACEFQSQGSRACRKSSFAAFGCSIDPPAAPSGHRGSGASRRCRERADRRGARCFLPEPGAQCGYRMAWSGRSLLQVEQLLVARRRSSRSRSSTAANASRRRRRQTPPGKEPWLTIVRPS